MTLTPAAAAALAQAMLLALAYGAGLGLDYFVLRRAARRRALALALLQAVVFLPLPLVIPAGALVARFLVAVVSALKVLRSVELALGHVRDPAMWSDWRRFVIWETTGSDTIWGRSAEERRDNRARGWRRAGEAAVYATATLGLVCALKACPSWPDMAFTRYLVELLIMGLVLPALTALTTVAPMLLGVDVVRIMNHPLRAASLGDFWGRRWNVAFRDVAHRNLYRPLRACGVPAAGAVLGVFAASGLAHEYLLAASLGSDLGRMSAFFLLQGVFLLAEQAGLARVPARARPLAGRIWLWGTLLATSPLFFEPFTRIIDIVGISRWMLAVFS